MVFPMEAASKGGAEEAAAVVDEGAPVGQAVKAPAQGDGDEYSTGATMGPQPPSPDQGPVLFGCIFDRLPRGRASLSSISLPSSGDHADAPFNLLPPDFIQWDPPLLQDDSSAGGFLGSLRFIVPFRQIPGLLLGRRAERIVANLSAVITAWCDADCRRTLLFHTFSNTGWVTYGAVLENLKSRADIFDRITGCIIDSAPVLELRPEVWAAGFSAAMLKKKSSLTGPSADSRDGSTWNGALQEVNSVSKLSRPSWGETLLQSTLHKLFKIVLRVPAVNQKLHKVLAVLSEKQLSCPEFYMYSSADRVIPAEYVEIFISSRRSLGLSVSAHNFVSSPHVDHYRSFPHLYCSKIDEFLMICSTGGLTCDELSFDQRG